MPTFVDDTFTAANATLVKSRAGEAGATWTSHPTTATSAFTINSNRAYCTTTGLLIASGVPATAEYDVQATVRALSTTQNFGILGRVHPTNATYYIFRLSSASNYELSRVVTGSTAVLDSAVSGVALATDYVWRMELRDGVQRVYVDDVLVCEAADTTITGAGSVGIRDTGAIGTGTGKHIDRITATDYVPSSLTIPVLDLGQSHVGPLRVGRN